MGEFTRNELRFLLSHSQPRLLEVGEYLFREGELGHCLFLVAWGNLEVLSEGASLRRIALRGKGQVIGEMALLEESGRRSASVRALQPTRLHSWSRQDFEMFLGRKPKLGLQLSRLLSQRMRDMQQQLETSGEIPRLGHSFGDYLLLEELGRGGMGGVFRALHRPSQQLVAVKVILSHHAGQEEAHQRFLRESKVLAQLQHPHIVHILEQGQLGQTPFLAMELVDGEGLDARLKRGALSLDEVLEWFVPVAEALHFAHSRGVAHRDVKPANILRQRQGAVKLIDFGLAREEDSTRLSMTGKNLGTPNYFAPERAGSHHPDLDRFADQYSLGVTLFEAVTGSLPFQAPDALALLMHHLKTRPPVPSSRRPDLPVEWDSLILRLLAKEPLQRFSSMAEVAQQLQRLGAGGGPTAEDLSETMAFE